MHTSFLAARLLQYFRNQTLETYTKTCLPNRTFVQNLEIVAFLQNLVTSLAHQKQFLPMAELEPQLWFQPFDSSAYQRMVTAEEEVKFWRVFRLACCHFE